VRLAIRARLSPACTVFAELERVLEVPLVTDLAIGADDLSGPRSIAAVSIG
jgi:hypothetical protein